MGDTQNWAALYRDSMAKCPYGHAFFEPPVLGPSFGLGKVGYTDDQGHWRLILDLADKKALADGKYTSFRPPVEAEPDHQTWGPVKSADVAETKITLSGEADAAALGIPVGFGGAIEYESASNFGAVLMSDVDVEITGYDVRGPFMKWLEENASKIRKNHKSEIGSRPLHAVIGIYASTDIFIHVMSERGKKVVVGFKAAAPGVASAELGTTWARSSVGSHWRQMNKKDEKVNKAMFMLSVTLSCGIFGRKEVRGGSKTKLIQVDDPDGQDPCEALIDSIGQFPGETSA
ncbi:hypothetical protein diail_9286 [Diaporthe ilicicola]|nr:hypothetical protein diail_9286 [Diaporthe ilicicola]